jgi:hypothetical protein
MNLTYSPGKSVNAVTLACKGTTQKVLGRTKETVIITFIKDRYHIRPIVVPNLANSINLGAHFLSRCKGIVDYKNNMVTLGQETIPFFSHCDALHYEIEADDYLVANGKGSDITLDTRVITEPTLNATVHSTAELETATISQTLAAAQVMGTGKTHVSFGTSATRFIPPNNQGRHA